MIKPIHLSQIESLAPMPKSAAYLARMQYQPDVWFDEAAKVLEVDEALTADVLRIANSAYSRALEPILTVKDALIRLGITNVLNVVLITALSAPMRSANPMYEMAENEMARHSLAAYLVASLLPEFSNADIPKASPTAALLHDIGKLVLGRYLDRALVGQVRQLVRDTKCPEVEAEQRLLGTDHAQIGMQIAQHWKFPGELWEAIRRHHDHEPPFDPLLDAVQISNWVAKQVGAGDVSVKKVKPDADLCKRLNLDNTALALLCVRAGEELESVEKILTPG